MKQTARTNIASFAPAFGAGSNLIGFMKWACAQSPVPPDAILDEDTQKEIYLHFAHLALSTVHKILESLEASGLLDSLETRRRIEAYFKGKFGSHLEEMVRQCSGGRTKNLMYLFYGEMYTLYVMSLSPEAYLPMTVKEDNDE